MTGKRLVKTLKPMIAALALAGCGQDDAETPPELPAVAPRAAAPAGTPRPAAPKAAAEAESFDLVGTEPFWAAHVRPDQISFSRADHATLSGANPGVRWQGDRRTWTVTSRLGEMRLVVEPGDCSDGMSDRRFAYHAEVSVGGQVVKGCATRAGRAAP